MNENDLCVKGDGARFRAIMVTALCSDDGIDGDISDATNCANKWNSPRGHPFDETYQDVCMIGTAARTVHGGARLRF